MCPFGATTYDIPNSQKNGFNYLFVKSPHVKEIPIFNKILTKCIVYFFDCRVHVRQSESMRAMISRINIHLRGGTLVESKPFDRRVVGSNRALVIIFGL